MVSMTCDKIKCKKKYIELSHLLREFASSLEEDDILMTKEAENTLRNVIFHSSIRKQEKNIINLSLDIKLLIFKFYIADTSLTYHKSVWYTIWMQRLMIMAISGKADYNVLLDHISNTYIYDVHNFHKRSLRVYKHLIYVTNTNVSFKDSIDAAIFIKIKNMEKYKYNSSDSQKLGFLLGYVNPIKEKCLKNIFISCQQTVLLGEPTYINFHLAKTLAKCERSYLKFPVSPFPNFDTISIVTDRQRPIWYVQQEPYFCMHLSQNYCKDLCHVEKYFEASDYFLF
tara:strand:- start:3090 stop:3941 length:852 start_codon:yes stop_codon:yes gene_type:complete